MLQWEKNTNSVAIIITANLTDPVITVFSFWKGLLLRKVILTSVALVLFIGMACNFPFTPSSRYPRQTETPDLSIFESLKTRTVLPGTPVSQEIPTEAAALEYDPSRYTEYTVQSGDILNVVAAHFSVAPDEILSSQELPTRGLLSAGQILVIPKLTEDPALPDFSTTRQRDREFTLRTKFQYRGVCKYCRWQVEHLFPECGFATVVRIRSG